MVARTRETDSVSGRVTEVEMRYHEGHFEPHTRQFQGFRKTERVEKGDASRPDTLLVYHFLMAQERLPGNGPEHAALNGVMSRVETYQLDGSPLQDRPYRVETCDPVLAVLGVAPDGRRRSFVFVTVHREEDNERTGDSRVEEKTYTYDASGNVTREVHRGSGTRGGVAQPGRVRTTETTYAAAAGRYLLDKPARIVAREEELVLTQAEFDAHYAGMNQAGLGFTPAANADGVASVFATPRRQRYDARSLLVATRDPLGTESVFTYDPTGLFRVKLTDPLGDTTFAYDRAVGQITQVTYADGAVARFDARPFGNATTANGNIDFRALSLHPVDLESGLIYMRRRYYSPLLGRFLTPDLMAIYRPEQFLHAPQGLHLYSFVANDPLNKTDLTGMSFWSFVGAVVGVAVGLAIIAAVVATGGLAGVLLGIGLAVGAGLAVTGISYLIANNVDPNSGFGQFMRGFMIGFNAGMNGALAGALFGPTVGVIVGVVNFLATFEGVAKNSVYRGILGWTSWVMPMSWGATALGLVFYVINLVVAGVTFQQWDAAKIDKLAIDWKTGTIVMVGGLIKNGTAFTNGNFVFMNQKWLDNPVSGGYDGVLKHGTGHTLNNAAFGTAFNLWDAVNEKIFGAGNRDYGEQVAESHANRPGRPTIPMWG